MAQKHFDFHVKCSDLEARNAELEAENEALKDKVGDLAFEVTLLRELCDYDEEETKDELIADLKQSLEAKDLKIVRLKAELYEKTEELANLTMTFNATTTPMETDELFEDLSEVFVEEPNTKTGEDLGDFVVEYTVIEPEEPKKKRKFVSRRVNCSRKKKG